MTTTEDPAAPDAVPGPLVALSLGLCMFLPAFGTHGLNATISDVAEQGGIRDSGLYRGLMMAAFPLAALVGYWIAGPASDAMGRRPLIRAGILGYAIAHVGLILITPFTEWTGLSAFTAFVALRLISGVFGGIVFVAANAMTGDLYPPGRRGRAMSLVWLGVPAALVIGVPLTAYLTAWSIELSDGVRYWIGQPYAVLALGVSLVSAAGVVLWLPSAPAQHGRRGKVSLLHSPQVFAPAIAFFMPFAVFQLLATVSQYSGTAFDWGAEQFGHLFVVLGITGVAGGILSGAVSDRVGKGRCLLLAQLSFVALVLVLPISRAGFFLVFSGLLSFLSTMRQGPFQAISAGLVETAQRGRMSSAVLGAGAMGTAAGQLSGSTLMASSNGFWAVSGSSAMAMAIAAGLFLIMRSKMRSLLDPTVHEAATAGGTSAPGSRR